MTPEPVPGPTNSLVDVAGLAVGQSQRVGDGWLTGTTVVLAPPEGAACGADVRGGGPGTRETDLLDPCNVVDRVHAVVLSGGSAFGLAAADGVMRWLLERGCGFAMGAPHEVVPIVPGAVMFDLGRGGRWDATPGPDLGAAACDDADRARTAGTGGYAVPPAQGVVGAGTGGQLAGGLKGGVGTASLVLPGGGTVAALVVLNAVGSTVDLRTGELLGARHLLPGDLDVIPGSARGSVRLRTPDPAEVEEARRRAAAAPGPPRTLATTIGVVATDLTLTDALCQRLAMSGQDGLARAIEPAHTMLDGDTLFGMSTGRLPAPPDLRGLDALLAGAATVVTRAIVRATLAAATVETPAGTWRSYRDAFPSALVHDPATAGAAGDGS
ncbi:P1 family peptidase [Ornithinimicrobium cerasi]|uniref:Putative pantetheine hydrolase n=1 Tax=Ornithinimicrobium cerasi TaxID=2248773 RepID=A0A285VUC2_9MICO|nr:P1 family peptidase [Ornithinimicrobium cerasi]SOC56826.1 putative pantetheine hydrolase [Ornithinimicrobium cerasi]